MNKMPFMVRLSLSNFWLIKTIMFMLNKIQSIANSELVYSAHLMVMKISIDISICCLSSNSLNAILYSPGNVMSCAKHVTSGDSRPTLFEDWASVWNAGKLGSRTSGSQGVRLTSFLRVLPFSIASELRIKASKNYTMDYESKVGKCFRLCWLSGTLLMDLTSNSQTHAESYTLRDSPVCKCTSQLMDIEISSWIYLEWSERPSVLSWILTFLSVVMMLKVPVFGKELRNGHYSRWWSTL